MRLTLVICFLTAVALSLASNARAGETTTTTTATTESYSETRAGIPRFTLDQAILTALQRNPDILRTRQDIERTKGLYIQMRAAILPQLNGLADFQDVDPHLGSVSTGVGSGFSSAERSYTLRLQVSQVIFAGGRVISQIRSADFQRDSSYYAFRNAIDSSSQRCGNNFISCSWIAR